MPALPVDEAPSHEPRRFLRRLTDRSTRVIRAVAPSGTAWRGATAAVVLATLTVWISVVIEVMSATAIAGPLTVGAGMVVVAAMIVGLLLLVLWAFRHAPLHFRWAILSSFLVLAFSLLLAPIGLLRAFAGSALVLSIVAITGGAVAVLYSGQWRSSGRVGRTVTIVWAVVGCGSIAVICIWLSGAGPPRGEIPNTAGAATAPRPPTSQANPALKGTHEVKTLTYGAGTDKHRPEFAAAAALRTSPVDGSKVLKGWDGVTGWARTRYWGFDAKALPLNGRVWYPSGEGPFPLVLIVHGNHLASDFSDPGYEYLGQLLASRGYIFVSVDENFLNSMETDFEWGLENENNARAWLLLEHLRVWHQWQSDEKSPFYHRVDTARLALVGHSRGGEAVAHAAAFNRLPFNPDNAKARFDYGYAIKSIVAIAPADGQYRPAGTRTTLSDINYFVIQGSHDSDVSSFMGLNQFDRVTFTGNGDWFKSAIYTYAANHGQFNTSWGVFDIGAGLSKHLVNTRALLDADEQRSVLCVYVAAFLDCTLGDVGEYRRLFQDWRYGAAWLPNTVYLTQYSDATMRPLCTFDEDIDLSTTTVAGGKIAGDHLTLWREQRLALRGEASDDRAVVLGWDRNHQQGEPSYQVTWPAGAFALGEDSELSFCLADGNEDPTPDDEALSERNKPPPADKPKADGQREPIDLTIELTDAEGATSRLPLSHFEALQPQIETLLLKATFLHPNHLSEPILQTFLFRLSEFRKVNPDFKPAAASKLRLIFDRTRSGVVIFDKAALGKAR
jgi:dienelactone hydrolase